MADRRLAARMQLVEVEDAPTATAPSRALDGHAAAGPGPGAAGRRGPAAAPLVARRGAGRRRPGGDRAWSSPPATGRSWRASPRLPACCDPSTRPRPPLWEVAGSPLPGTVLAADGSIVVLTEGVDEWTVAAHDPASGAVRWDGLGGTVLPCGLRGDGRDLPGAARVTSGRSWSASSGSRGSCTPTTPRSRSRPGSRWSRCPRRTASASAAWEVRGTIVGIDRVEDDLVIGSLDDDGRMVVQRRDARTGDVVWSMVTPAADGGAEHRRHGHDAGAAAGRRR